MKKGNTKLSAKLARHIEKMKAAKKKQPTFKKVVDKDGENWGVATMPANW